MDVIIFTKSPEFLATSLEMKGSVGFSLQGIVCHEFIFGGATVTKYKYQYMFSHFALCLKCPEMWTIKYWFLLHVKSSASSRTVAVAQSATVLPCCPNLIL